MVAGIRGLCRLRYRGWLWGRDHWRRGRWGRWCHDGGWPKGLVRHRGLLLEGLLLRLVLDVPQHVADEDRPPEAPLVVLPGHVQLVERHAQHPGPLALVAEALFPLQAVGVVADRAGLLEVNGTGLDTPSEAGPRRRGRGDGGTSAVHQVVLGLELADWGHWYMRVLLLLLLLLDLIKKREKRL